MFREHMKALLFVCSPRFRVGVGLARNPSHRRGESLYSQMNARDVLASTSLERRLMPKEH